MSVIEAIIILGGRADVYNEKDYPWLVPEKELIKNALYHDIPLLGICLGCQLIAEQCGGTVIPGTRGKEVGYKQWYFHNKNPILTSTSPTSLQQKDKENNGGGIDESEYSVSEATRVRARDDPFLYALKEKGLDKYVVLFHGDTFTLPKIYKSKSKEKKILHLASTDKYPTLWR